MKITLKFLSVIAALSLIGTVRAENPDIAVWAFCKIESYERWSDHITSVESLKISLGSIDEEKATEFKETGEFRAIFLVPSTKGLEKLGSALTFAVDAAGICISTGVDSWHCQRNCYFHATEAVAIAARQKEGGWLDPFPWPDLSDTAKMAPVQPARKSATKDDFAITITTDANAQPPSQKAAYEAKEAARRLAEEKLAKQREGAKRERASRVEAAKRPLPICTAIPPAACATAQ